MKVFEQVGYSGNELRRLDRVRVHQQVLFLSCVLGASSEKMLDKWYLERRQTNEPWPRLHFSNKNRPNKDFALWKQALRHIVPADDIMDRLGWFNHNRYKIWPWRHTMYQNIFSIAPRAEYISILRSKISEHDQLHVRNSLRWASRKT